MALDLVQEIEVLTEYIKLKFGVTPKASTITNQAFKVYLNSATPSLISNPFAVIDLSNDYQSVGKILFLYWNANVLAANTDYKLIITGLKDAADVVIPDFVFYFTTGAAVTQDPTILPPEPTPLEIEDHSIKSAAFTDITTIIATNPDMYIISVDPENQDFDLPEDYNNGQIAIKFSSLPNGMFLNNNYFKVQKRKVQRGPTRWQTISTQVVGDSSSGIVYVSLPSTDATPVFGVADKTYFEPQYKYRVIVSKDVGV